MSQAVHIQLLIYPQSDDRARPLNRAQSSSIKMAPLAPSSSTTSTPSSAGSEAPCLTFFASRGSDSSSRDLLSFGLLSPSSPRFPLDWDTAVGSAAGSCFGFFGISNFSSESALTGFSGSSSLACCTLSTTLTKGSSSSSSITVKKESGLMPGAC